MADDVRTRVTKQLLKEALKNEIEKKTIDQITVRAICEAAHVSRPTFYTYYQDIFELYLDCERDLIGELGLPQNMEKLFSPDESEQIILRILDLYRKECSGTDYPGCLPDAGRNRAVCVPRGGGYFYFVSHLRPDGVNRPLAE